MSHDLHRISQAMNFFIKKGIHSVLPRLHHQCVSVLTWFSLMVFLAPEAVVSQSKRDSLLAVWQNIEIPDSTGVKALSQLARYYFSTNLDSAIICAQAQLGLAEAIGDQYQMADALNGLGAMYNSKRDYQSGIA